MARFLLFTAGILSMSFPLMAAGEINHGTTTTQSADPDADLHTLAEFDIHRKEIVGDDQYWNLVKTLGTLNTQRTFDIIVKRLDSRNMFEREQAVTLMGVYKLPGCVPALAKVLENDPEPQLQHDAAEQLIYFPGDRRAEPALLKAVQSKKSWVANFAGWALGLMQSDDGFQMTVALLNQPNGEEYAIVAVASYHRKQSVVAILKKWAQLQSLPDGDAGRKIRIEQIEWVLRGFAGVTRKQLGPMPDSLEQWNDWWVHAEPLLDDRLQLKDKPVPVKYVDTDFRQAPEAIELRAKLDAKMYRVGDPMRLDLEMENHSKNPYSLILPRPPSGWFPTMAYGIRLSRGSEVIFDVPPSDFYVGSYGGPPGFETLKPGETFKSSVSLWYWLRGDLDLPLREGDYELTIAFDSSKYSGVAPSHSQLIHRWDAEPVKFRIVGPARSDPVQVLKLIAQESGLKWIDQDVESQQDDRQNAAWMAIYTYGDSRLAQFVKSHARDSHARAYQLCAENLVPFEAKSNRIVPK